MSELPRSSSASKVDIHAEGALTLVRRAGLLLDAPSTAPRCALLTACRPNIILALRRCQLRRWWPWRRKAFVPPIEFRKIMCGKSALAARLLASFCEQSKATSREGAFEHN